MVYEIIQKDIDLNMHNEITGSLKQECNQRLSNLYKQSHTWLLQASYNICKSFEESEELVSDLYLYLAKDCRKNIWWGDSYNLIYCQKFLRHRWLNRVEKLKRYHYTDNHNTMDDVNSDYDEQKDRDIMRAYDDVISELRNLQTTRLWPQARLFELYWCSDDTLNEVAKKIGISKSTTFLAIKKIRTHMKGVINNPFE
jgi:DNA-directed RNA polymerase specialized sigma24 family protein